MINKSHEENEYDYIEIHRECAFCGNVEVSKKIKIKKK